MAMHIDSLAQDTAADPPTDDGSLAESGSCAQAVPSQCAENGTSKGALIEKPTAMQFVGLVQDAALKPEYSLGRAVVLGVAARPWAALAPAVAFADVISTSATNAAVVAMGWVTDRSLMGSPP